MLRDTTFTLPTLFDPCTVSTVLLSWPASSQWCWILAGGRSGTCSKIGFSMCRRLQLQIHSQQQEQRQQHKELHPHHQQQLMQSLRLVRQQQQYLPHQQPQQQRDLSRHLQQCLQQRQQSFRQCKNSKMTRNSLYRPTCAISSQKASGGRGLPRLQQTVLLAPAPRYGQCAI